MSGEDEKAQVEAPEVEASKADSKAVSKMDETKESVVNGEEEKDMKKAPKRKAATNKKADVESDEAEADNEDIKKSPRKKKVPLPKKSPAKKSKKKESSDEEEEEIEKKPSKKPASPKKGSKDTKKDEIDEADGDDAEEEEEEENEEPQKKGVPLLDQPLEISGSRERKKVARFEYNTSEDDKKSFSVPEGKGTKLGEIPRIDHFINKFKVEQLKPASKALFGSRGPVKATLKKALRSFNGYDFDETSEQWDKRKQLISKLGVKSLKVVCEMLDLERSGTVQAFTERIMEFCSKPQDNGKKPPVPKSKRKSQSKARKIGADSEESDAKPSRSKRGKGKRVSLKDASDDDSDAQPKRASKRPAKKSNYKDESSGEDADKDKEDIESDKEESKEDLEQDEEDKSVEKSDAEEEVEEEEELETEKEKKDEEEEVEEEEKEKTKGKKGKRPAPKKAPAKTAKKAPAKKAAPKKKAASESEPEDEASSSEDDEPLVKKAKPQPPPTDEDIKTYVKKILEGANLEEITMKTVCKQVYENYPDHDLAHKKDLIKETVKSLIST